MSPELREANTRQPLDIVRAYLYILRESEPELYVDPETYEKAQGMLDDVFFDNTTTHAVHEVHTSQALRDLIDYQHKPGSIRRAAYNDSRKEAAAHVVRGMIQGDKFPVEHFGKVITSVISTMQAIDNFETPRHRHTKRVREEIIDVWGFASDSVSMRRTAEAFKYIGRARAYGRMMTRVAKVEKKKI